MKSKLIVIAFILSLFSFDLLGQINVSDAFNTQPEVKTEKEKKDKTEKEKKIKPDKEIKVEKRDMTIMPDLPIDIINNKITYAGTSLDSTGKIRDTIGIKDVLFTRAKEWFIKNYDASNVMQMGNKDIGRIMAKGYIQVYSYSFGKSKESGFIYYTLSTTFKDNMYKYKITNFYYTYDDRKYLPCEDMIYSSKNKLAKWQRKIYNYYFNTMNDSINILIKDFKSAMNKNSKYTNDYLEENINW